MPAARSLARALRVAASALFLLGVGGTIAAASDGPTPAAATVTVDVTLAGDLFPGAPAANATVTLGNPGAVPLLVVSLLASAGAGTAAACAPALLIPTGELLATPVTVPAGGSVVVQAPAPALAADAAADCAGAPFVVDYTANAVAG